MSIKVKGLSALVSDIVKFPKQIDRAARQSIDRTVTDLLRRIERPLKRIGLTQKKVRSRLVIERPSKTKKAEGIITPNNAIIPLTEYKYQIRKKRKSKTRATVHAQLDPFGRKRKLPRVFVNPKNPGRKEPLFRDANVGRLPVLPAFGPSIGKHFETLVDRKFNQKTNIFLHNDFRRRLRRIR